MSDRKRKHDCLEEENNDASRPRSSGSPMESSSRRPDSPMNFSSEIPPSPSTPPRVRPAPQPYPSFSQHINRNISLPGHRPNCNCKPCLDLRNW